MSAKKFESADSFQQPITVEGRQSRLELSAESVVIHKSGIEFRSPTPFNPWTEMTSPCNRARRRSDSMQRRGYRLFRQQTHRLPCFACFSRHVQAGAIALEPHGALGFGRGLTAGFPRPAVLNVRELISRPYYWLIKKK